MKEIEIIINILNYFNSFNACWLLDSDNILYKKINDEWIGKRSVWTFNYRSCWLEDTTQDNIKTFWCGKGSDYNEIFKLNERN